MTSLPDTAENKEPEVPQDEAAPPEPAPAPEVPQSETPAPEAQPEPPAPPQDKPAKAGPKKKAKVSQKKVRKLRRKKRRILERTAENDIRYRGPLSYRHFRALAWICLALSQVVLLMRLDQKLEPEYAAIYDTPIAIMAPIASLALPLLLVANFAVILDGREGYLRQMLRYGAFFAAVTAGYELFCSRYVLGGLGVLIQSPEEAPAYLDKIITHLLPQGYLAFNIFVDLFLCSLFMFLMNYRPKRVLKGKWVLVLRFLAILPPAYEIGCIVLKVLGAWGRLRLPLWTYPFLTTKPPMTFLVFIILTFYVKRRERLFIRHGRTHEDFLRHMQTNYNSLRFSFFTAGIFLLTAILDLIAVFVVPMAVILIGGEEMELYGELMNVMVNSGFGGSIQLLPMIPFMLLFSYTRTYKNRLFDAILPLIGIALIFCVYIEGGYQALQLYGTCLPDGFGEMIKMLITGLFP